jgi:hypothetical protein
VGFTTKIERFFAINQIVTCGAGVFCWLFGPGFSVLGLEGMYLREWVVIVPDG